MFVERVHFLLSIEMGGMSDKTYGQVNVWAGSVQSKMLFHPTIQLSFA